MSSRTFLGFAMKRPHLCAIDLPQEPRLRRVTGSANRAETAFDHIWIRGNWIAITAHQELWSLPIPLSGEAVLLSSRWDALPADDGNTMWVPHPSGESWIRVDGNGSPSGIPLVRRQGERLEAVLGQTALVRDGENQELKLRRQDGNDYPVGQGFAMCQAGSLAFVQSDLGATLTALDLFTGSRSVIPRVGFGRWGPFAETSPDGTMIAIVCQMAPAPKPKPPAMSFADWIRHPDNQRSTDYRSVLALLSATSLELTVLEHIFDELVGRPAWSANGEAVVFWIRGRNMFAWVDVKTGKVTRVRGPNQSPVPLCDATDLIGQGIE